MSIIETALNLEVLVCTRSSHLDHTQWILIGMSSVRLQIEWDDNEEFYRAWEEARTGYPWIDAIMTQLREQGWMHHLARHAVVSLNSFCVFYDPALLLRGSRCSSVKCDVPAP